MTMSIRWTRRLTALALALTAGLGTAVQAETLPSGMIPAAGRVDIAFDAKSQVLYISGGPEVRRFDVKTKTFLEPLKLGGATMGMDVSADGKKLAVANASRGARDVFVDVVTLKTGKSKRVSFPLESGEGGSYTVAYDAQGQLLVTTSYEGSGWTPLRKYDPATGLTVKLADLSEAAVNPSPNHKYVGVVEGNSSNGPYGIYTTGDSTYHERADTDAWLSEIAVAPNGGQIAIPTYMGTLIDDAKKTLPSVGTYGVSVPIGAAYAPSGDFIYYSFSNSSYVVEYDRRTMTEVRKVTVPGKFDWWPMPLEEGRVKVSSDGRLLFVTLDDGVFYQVLSAN